MNTTPDDPRAQFVIAQYLIDEGRPTEALPLLVALAERFPLLDDWIEKIEYGEEVDTASLRWEPDMVRPLPAREERKRPKFQAGKALVAFLMALSLFAPIVQFMLPPPTNTSAPSQVTEADRVRGAARERVRQGCHRAVITAIEDGRLQREIGSCMQWSFQLPEREVRAAVACHEYFPDDDRAFGACVIESGVYPDGLRPPGTTDG